MLGRATIPRRAIFRTARARRARVDATSRHPCPAQVHKAAPSIPDGAVALAVRKVRKSVKYRTQFDILKCNPVKKVHAMAAPLLLIHGRDDDFIKPDHSDAIEAAYGGKDVHLLKPLGGHNSRRSFDTYVAVCVEINHWFGGSPPNFRTL